MNKESNMGRRISIPISAEVINSLKVGDTVLLTGLIITARDAAHKWLVERFIQKIEDPSEADLKVYEEIKPLLQRGLIYHCGPVVSGLDTKQYSFVAAGPTTSIREELYQAEVMRHFNLAGVIGKGGMGQKTLKACGEIPAVYFHAIGGAAALIAKSVQRVLGVHKLEFGVPEAMWVIDVVDFPVVVTMDKHGGSLHNNIRIDSQKALDQLLDIKRLP